jgi:hypothetical protein
MGRPSYIRIADREIAYDKTPRRVALNRRMSQETRETPHGKFGQIGAMYLGRASHKKATIPVFTFLFYFIFIFFLFRVFTTFYTSTSLPYEH